MQKPLQKPKNAKTIVKQIATIGKVAKIILKNHSKNAKSIVKMQEKGY